MISERFLSIPFALAFLCLLFPYHIRAQDVSYTQIWSEIDLVRAINDKWAAEIDFSASYSNTPVESRVLKTNTQRSAVIWLQYFHSPRWKFSSFLGYYRNKDVPDIGQYEATEWRAGLQGTYYFHKVTYSLNTDMRAEVRFLQNKEGVYEDIYRYRQKLQFRLPLNSKILRGGVVYVRATEEVIFRTKYKETGLHYFDCNIFTIGGGYLFTDDLQLEMVYANVFIPRDNGNETDNAVSVTFTVNNLLRKIGKLVTGTKVKPVPED